MTNPIREVKKDTVGFGPHGTDSAGRPGKSDRADEGFLIDSPVSTATLRTYHRNMLKRAEQSVEGTEYPLRVLMGQTLAFPSRRVQAARDLLSEFVDRFNSEFSGAGGDQVYHLEMVFFPLTLNNNIQPDQTRR